jgi:flagellin
MRELSVQGANDTNNEQDRGNLQSEMNALTSEINRISGVTTWAGNSVMAGDPVGTSNSSRTFSLQVGAATGTKNQINVVVKAVDTTTLGVTTAAAKSASDVAANASTAVNGTDGADGVFVLHGGTTDTAAAAKMTFAINVKGDSTVETFSFESATALDHATSPTNKAIVGAEIAAKINDDADLIAVGIGATAHATTGTVSLTYATYTSSVDNAAHARVSIDKIDAAIKIVNTQRSELGAVSNRLSHTVSNMTNISTNLSAARGGIQDADFAVETTNLAKNQILQQASTAMLAQANASKQNVLSLLQ